MAFNVRIYGHRSLEQMPHKDRQYTGDTVFNLSQPYEWARLISVSGVAASSDPVADANSGAAVNILRIEVPDGQAVRYEINPPNREGGAVAANVNSPILSGHDQFYFRGGWTISLIDAAGLP